MDKALKWHIFRREGLVFVFFMGLAVLAAIYVQDHEIVDLAGYLLFYGYPIYLVIRLYFFLRKRNKKNVIDK